MKSNNLVILSIVAVLAITAMILTATKGHYAMPDSPSDLFGLAIEGFSDPISTFTFNNNIVSASDSAVYKYGYYSVDGAPWQQFTLNGNALGGNWLTGTATKTLPDFGPGEHYVVIYSCTRVSGAWNCHDNKWQIKVVNNEAVPTLTATCSDSIRNQGETGIDCGGPCTACQTSKGQTYYIATTGTDSSTRDGSATNPWKTLSYACSRVTTPGAVIHVSKGTYHETSQCKLAIGVSIEGEGTESNIVSDYVGSYTSGLITLRQPSAVNPVDGNQSISYIRLDGNNLYAHSSITSAYRNNVEIHHCTVTDFKYNGISFLSNNYWPNPPSVNYATGNSIHDCVITNSASTGSSVWASVWIDGQTGFLFYNNICSNTDRSDGLNGNIMKTNWHKGLKIFNNTLTKNNDLIGWNFFGEFFFWQGGGEIYGNTFNGAATLDIVNVVKGSYDYGIKIYDNNFLVPVKSAHNEHSVQAIDFEGWGNLEDIYVYNNYFKNSPNGIWFDAVIQSFMTRMDIKNVFVYYNVFENIGETTGGGIGVLINSYLNSPENSDEIYWDNINVLNNVITSDAAEPYNGIQVSAGGTLKNIKIKNNIITDCRAAVISVERSIADATVTGLSIENNIFYNNGNNNLPRYISITPTQITGISPQTNKIGVDPMFISSNDFHLRTGSPAINAGTSVGLTKDHDYTPITGLPDIGTYEYN